MSGSASYSVRIATVGPFDRPAASPRYAVSMSLYLRCTVKPFASMNSVSFAADLRSW